MKDKLITKNYIEILAANFLLFFGFWLLMPVLPFYLAEVFDANKTTIGAVLSCYTIAALCIRPFSGYLLDTFARKPLYLLAYFTFTAIRSVSFPLFPSSPVRFFRVLGQKWVRENFEITKQKLSSVCPI